MHTDYRKAARNIHDNDLNRSRTSLLRDQLNNPQWVIDLMNQLGYREAAKEESRVLPDQLDRKQLEELCDRHGIPRLN